MALAALALLLVVVCAVVGVAVRRWRLLAVLAILWLLFELSIVLFGGLQSDEDTPTTLLLMSVIFLLLPAEIGAAVGTAVGKLLRRRRGSGHRAARSTAQRLPTAADLLVVGQRNGSLGAALGRARSAGLAHSGVWRWLARDGYVLLFGDASALNAVDRHFVTRLRGIREEWMPTNIARGHRDSSPRFDLRGVNPLPRAPSPPLRSCGHRLHLAALILDEHPVATPVEKRTSYLLTHHHDGLSLLRSGYGRRMMRAATVAAVLIVLGGWASPLAGCGGSDKRVGLTRAQAERQARRSLDQITSRYGRRCAPSLRVTKLACHPKANGWACPYTLSNGDTGVTTLTGKPHPEITTIC